MFLDVVLTHSLLQTVQWTFDLLYDLVTDVYVAHCSLYVVVAEQFLNELDVGAILKQVSGITVP
nr:hypothetical protein A6C57_18650 [Fibrella sp. ES10-3-2-2]